MLAVKNGEHLRMTMGLPLSWQRRSALLFRIRNDKCDSISDRHAAAAAARNVIALS
jgi:hypothetical protein